MSLTTNIQTIVNTKFPDATYALSSWFKANTKSYNLEEMTVAKPFIVLNNELTKGKTIEKNANVLANSKIMMWFLAKVDVNATDSEMNTIIESLEGIADQVYNNIYQLSKVRLNEGEKFRYEVTPKFKIWNSVLCGVEVMANVKENEIINFCKS